MEIVSILYFVVLPATLFLILYILNAIYFLRLSGDPQKKQFYTNLLIISFLIWLTSIFYSFILFFQLQENSIEITSDVENKLLVFLSIVYSVILLQAFVINKLFSHSKKKENMGKEQKVMVFWILALCITEIPSVLATMYIFNVLWLSA